MVKADVTATQGRGEQHEVSVSQALQFNVLNDTQARPHPSQLTRNPLGSDTSPWKQRSNAELHDTLLFDIFMPDRASRDTLPYEHLHELSVVGHDAVE